MILRLQQAGIDVEWHRVETEADYLSALETELDLILADFSLPHFNAAQALRLLNERELDIPFIIVSGSIGEDIAVAAMKEGADDYLLKDRLARLDQSVAHALKARRMRDDRKWAEEALRESEARFRVVFEHANDAIHIDTADDEIIHVNQRLCDMMGYSREELLRMRVSDLQAPEHRQPDPVIRKELARYGSDVFEGLNLHRSGRRIPVEISVARIERPQGDWYVSIVRDITERKRREREMEAIASIATALRAAYTRADMLPVILDQLLSLLNVQGAALEMLDPASGELLAELGRGVWQSVTGERIPPGAGLSAQVLTSGQPYLNNDAAHDLRLYHPELFGECRAAAGVPLMMKDQIIGLLWIGSQRSLSDHDLQLLTAIADMAASAIHRAALHEQTEARLRELETIAAVSAALRAAPTRADMLPVIVNQVLSLLKADGAALATRDPATGETIIALGRGACTDWTGMRLPPSAGVIGHVITTGRLYVSDDAVHDPRIVRPDLIGDLRAVVCVPLIAHEATIGALWVGRTTALAEVELRLLTAISDIAANALQRAWIVETLEQRVDDRTRQLAEANERLEELDRLKSKFVSDVSHELRTPVTILKLHAELLVHGKPEKRDYYLKVIAEQADRQAKLVEDILNLSRLELGADKVQFAPVALNPLIKQIAAAHQPAAEAASLTLTFIPDPDLPPVRGEVNQLAQVFTNVIANAINYTPAGHVQVRTRLIDHQPCIEVQDTGMGIDAEDLPHLFERFYRGKHARKIRGTGLGLAIVKEIVDLHSGRIEVMSEVGVGSTFRICLPIVESSA
jgi:adenylate cyclase